MRLQRVGGRIIDADAGNAPVVFAGGFFRPFTTFEPNQTEPTPERGLIDANGRFYSITPSNSACATAEARASTCFCEGNRGARLDRWNWETALTAIANRGVNLVRVFSMGGNEFRANGSPVDVYPFDRDAAGLFKVKAAVKENDWNSDYFLTYMRPFVDAAARKGIAVQLCLFTYHEFLNESSQYFAYWPRTPWNPAATTPSSWGETEQYLIHSGVAGDPISRNFYFTNVANAKLLETQRWFAGCVVQTLRGAGNVILELFNEPRSLRRNRDDPNMILEDNRVTLATWYEWLTNTVLGFCAQVGWRPLLSVNASDFHPEGKWDVDVWRERSAGAFSQIDMISYHGMTGYGEVYVGNSPCAERRFAPVAPVHMDNRIATHQSTVAPRPNGAFPDQPLIFSTDAVKKPTHVFDDLDRAGNIYELEKRDGQIQTDLGNDASDVQEIEHRSDLENWAYWALLRAVLPANQGRVHFQNHSVYRDSFARIGEAKVEVMNMGEMLRPAYTSAGWTQYSYLADRNAGRNFWWAQRYLTAEGGSVTQLGTVQAPADPRWEQLVETGWRLTFTAPATRWCCFNVSYTPVSVSDREQGATVSPMVVARLHEVASGGALRPALASREVLVAPGARPNKIAVSGDLVAGRQYALVFAGAVKVNYRNFYQGYGEVIVHFPSVRKVG